MHPVGIEFISVFGQPPVDFVHTAADVGADRIGMAPAPIVTLPDLYPSWSLVDDPQLRRDVKQALAERELSVSLGEGFLIWPGRDVSEYDAAVDAMTEIGAPVLNAVCLNPEPGEARDQFGVFAEMASARGLRSTVEFVPGTPIGTLAAAVDLVRRVGRADFGLLLDSMHLFRTGSTVADVAALDPALIGYVQICDVPLASSYADYSEEARFDRRAPGEGELPLRELVAALPDNMVLGLEVPMRSRAEAGQNPRDYLRPAIKAARALASA